MKKHVDQYNEISNKLKTDKAKDEAFARKLSEMEEDSIDDALPTRKQLRPAAK